MAERLTFPTTAAPSQLWPAVLARMEGSGPARYSLDPAQHEVLWHTAWHWLPRHPLIVELGVCVGHTAVLLATLAHAFDGRYLGIDTWMLEGTRDDVAARLAATIDSPCWTLVQGRTQDVDVPPAIDLLLLDAGHDEANVRADCLRWIPAVTRGGLLAAHDYDDPIDPASPHWAVRHYVDRATSTWQTVAQCGGLLIRRNQP